MVKLQSPGYVFIAQFAAHLLNFLLAMTLVLALVNYHLFHFIMSSAQSFRFDYKFSLPAYLLISLCS